MNRTLTELYATGVTPTETLADGLPIFDGWRHIGKAANGDPVYEPKDVARPLTDDDKFSIEDALAAARRARPGATRAELVDELRCTNWEPALGAAVADAAAEWVLR